MFIMDAIIRFFNGRPFFSLSAVHRTVWTLEGECGKFGLAVLYEQWRWIRHTTYIQARMRRLIAATSLALRMCVCTYIPYTLGIGY